MSGPLPEIRGRTCAVLPPETPTAALPKQATGKARKRNASSTSHRFQTFNTFYDETLRTISNPAGLVWVGLWRECRAPEWTATVSQKWLADRMGVSVDTVKRGVRELEKAKLVDVLRRGNSYSGASTYRIRPKPEPV